MSSAYFETHSYKKFNSSSTIESLQDDLDETASILKSNLSKLNDRENVIIDIGNKSEHLVINAKKFKNRSTSLKNKSFFQAYMCEIFLVIIVVIIIFLIIYVLSN